MPTLTPAQHRALDGLHDWRHIVCEQWSDVDQCLSPDVNIDALPHVWNISRLDMDKLSQLTTSIAWRYSKLYPGADEMIFEDVVHLIESACNTDVTKRPNHYEVERAITRACNAIQRIEWTILYGADSDALPAAVQVSRGDGASHGPDFRSVRWYGADYAFTGNQAAVVKILWEAWENGTPEVSDAHLLTKAGSDCKRLADVFRDAKSRKQQDAWDKMIVSGTTKGTRRLNSPKKLNFDQKST